MVHLLKSFRYSWLALETVQLVCEKQFTIVTQTPVAGYDAKKSISPNFPISLNKFLLEYVNILAVISLQTTFVIFSKSSFSIM